MFHQRNGTAYCLSLRFSIDNSVIKNCPYLGPVRGLEMQLLRGFATEVVALDEVGWSERCVRTRVE